jgi:hypothetical protein
MSPTLLTAAVVEVAYCEPTDEIAALQGDCKEVEEFARAVDPPAAVAGLDRYTV